MLQPSTILDITRAIKGDDFSHDKHFYLRNFRVENISTCVLFLRNSEKTAAQGNFYGYEALSHQMATQNAQETSTFVEPYTGSIYSAVRCTLARNFDKRIVSVRQQRAPQ